MTTVFIPRGAHLNDESAFTKREKVDAKIHPGRRTQVKGYQSPASWISDLSELKKLIILCSFCRPWFDPKRYRYRKMQVFVQSEMKTTEKVNGVCDRCKQRTADMGGGTAFVHEEIYQQVCTDPRVARRNARIAAQRVISGLHRS
jgi:hypothetical protein